jgi:DNA invertase Pin-like site-specific DNA recombinase
MTKFIIYTRVSTAKQGRSGLSLEAQESRCRQFAEQNGGEVLDAYSEVISGYKEKLRPKLNAALEHARRSNAALLLWEMDRLGRHVGRLVEILDNSGVQVVIGSNPEMNSFMRHIYAAQAQEESRIRSERIKRALQAKKRRGEVWNKQNGSAELVSKMTAARIEKARSNPNSQMAATVVKHMKANGASLRAIAAELNKAGFKTPSGKIGKFTPTTVKNLIQRLNVNV